MGEFCGAKGGKSLTILFGVSERSTRVDSDVFVTLKLWYLGMQATKVVCLGGLVMVTDNFLDLVASYVLELVKIHSQTGSVIHSFSAGKGGYSVH